MSTFNTNSITFSASETTGLSLCLNLEYLYMCKSMAFIFNLKLIACPSSPTIQIVFVKKPNTLNYPIIFGYLGDLAKFSLILHEHRIFLSLVFFVKIWQCLASCSCQSKRLIIARYKIK